MDERFTAKFWDEHYSSASQLWSGNPNPLLVEEIADLATGVALDAGCGEGADAVWLATRGWRVTAADISTVALERGSRHADPEIADRISWERFDLATWVPEQQYDLVSAHFMHFPSTLRVSVYERLAEAVSPGGTLLVVAHHPSDLETTMPRPHEPDLFFTAEELAASLAPDQWDVLVADARPRHIQDPGGLGITVHDAVLRARKRP